MNQTYSTSSRAHGYDGTPRVGVRIVAFCRWQFSGVVPATDCVDPVVVNGTAQVFPSRGHGCHQRPLVLSGIVPLDWIAHKTTWKYVIFVVYCTPARWCTVWPLRDPVYNCIVLIVIDISMYGVLYIMNILRCLILPTCVIYVMYPFDMRYQL